MEHAIPTDESNLLKAPELYSQVPRGSRPQRPRVRTEKTEMYKSHFPKVWWRRPRKDNWHKNRDLKLNTLMDGAQGQNMSSDLLDHLARRQRMSCTCILSSFNQSRFDDSHALHFHDNIAALRFADQYCLCINTNNNTFEHATQRTVRQIHVASRL